MGFIDDNPDLKGKKFNDYPVLGNVNWLLKKEHRDTGCVCAIGDPQTKKRITRELERHNVTFHNAIHPSVIKSDSVDIGKDVIICAGSILTVNITIKDHVTINLNCTVGHDSVIREYTTILPTVKISGFNHFGQGCFIGTGAAFIHELSIGKNAAIGAGTVVINDILDNAVAVGVPAKVIKYKKKL